MPWRSPAGKPPKSIVQNPRFSTYHFENKPSQPFNMDSIIDLCISEEETSSLPAPRFNLLLRVNKKNSVHCQETDDSSDYPLTDDEQVYGNISESSTSFFDYERSVIVGMCWWGSGHKQVPPAGKRAKHLDSRNTDKKNLPPVNNAQLMLPQIEDRK